MATTINTSAADASYGSMTFLCEDGNVSTVRFQRDGSWRVTPSATNETCADYVELEDWAVEHFHEMLMGQARLLKLTGVALSFELPGLDGYAVVESQGFHRDDSTHLIMTRLLKQGGLYAVDVVYSDAPGKSSLCTFAREGDARTNFASVRAGLEEQIWLATPVDEPLGRYPLAASPLTPVFL